MRPGVVTERARAGMVCVCVYTSAAPPYLEPGCNPPGELTHSVRERERESGEGENQAAEKSCARPVRNKKRCAALLNSVIVLLVLHAALLWPLYIYIYIFSRPREESEKRESLS